MGLPLTYRSDGSRFDFWLVSWFEENPLMAFATTDFLYSTICTDEDMVEVVQEFLSELPQRLAQIHTALEAGDLAALARLTHQLKGAGGSYGFAELTASAAEMEKLVRQQATTADLAAAFDSLLSLTARLQAVPAV